MKKIAFLFLTIENPNFPKIWDEYFKGHENKYSIYIHAKYPEKITWHKECIIKNIVPTAWGFITRAYIELMKEAIKDKNNVKFITVSESCIPIKTFDIFYKDCINIKQSFIKTMKISKYDQEERINKHIKEIKNAKDIKIPKHFLKNYARFCLNKKHVELLLKKDKNKDLEFFHTMHVGDEFFLSVLYPLTDYIDFEVIFDDWDYVRDRIKEINNLLKKTFDLQEKKNISLEKEINELRELKQNIAKNPKTIINVREDLTKIKNSKSYFYRKFSPKSDIEKYIYKIWNNKN